VISLQQVVEWDEPPSTGHRLPVLGSLHREHGCWLIHRIYFKVVVGTSHHVSLPLHTVSGLQVRLETGCSDCVLALVLLPHLVDVRVLYFTVDTRWQVKLM